MCERYLLSAIRLPPWSLDFGNREGCGSIPALPSGTSSKGDLIDCGKSRGIGPIAVGFSAGVRIAGFVSEVALLVTRFRNLGRGGFFVASKD